MFNKVLFVWDSEHVLKTDEVNISTMQIIITCLMQICVSNFPPMNLFKQFLIVEWK